MSSNGAIHEFVQRLDEARVSKDATDTDQVWSSISGALRSVANQFKEWSRLLTSVAQPIDLEILEEMAGALDEFQTAVIELELWLSLGNDKRRITLLKNLSETRDAWQKSEARGYLVSYLQWLRLQQGNSVIEPSDRVNQRCWAGDRLIEFAIRLEWAVSKSET